MTTRLTPRAVKPRGEFLVGCRELELTSLQPADAVEFFHKQKIKGTHAEIEAACAPYGYHPLSLRLLAGRILKDFENPADIVVAQNLKIDGDIIQQKHHVLEVSYNSLPEHEQKLLSTIACFRSPVEIKTLESIEESNKSLQDDLHDLVARGLLHFDDKNKKFDLHPIVRRYAYERLILSDRTDTHARLCDYFIAVETPSQPQTLEELAPVIELYYHTVRTGELDKARKLLRERLIPYPLYFRFGAYGICIDLSRALFVNGEDNLPPLKDEAWQAWAINSLASSYFMVGQSHHAILLGEQNVKIREKHNNKTNLAIALENLGQRQISIGALQNAEHNLQRSMLLYKETQNENDETIGCLELGRLKSYLGAWNDAKKEFARSMELLEKQQGIQNRAMALEYITASTILMNRDVTQTASFNPKMTIENAQYALELTEEGARTHYPVEINFIRAYWILGSAYRINKQHKQAERYLNEALLRDRAINMIVLEADILLDLARLCFDLENYEEAKSLADEALFITERCGYVLQGADVNLFLAELILTLDPSPEGRGKVRAYAEEALKLATCDGPPYYYKVAYEEAERFLAKLQG